MNVNDFISADGGKENKFQPYLGQIVSIGNNTITIRLSNGTLLEKWKSEFYHSKESVSATKKFREERAAKIKAIAADRFAKIKTKRK